MPRPESRKEALAELIEGMPIIFDSDFLRIANLLRPCCDIYSTIEYRTKCYEKIEEFKSFIITG